MQKNKLIKDSNMMRTAIIGDFELAFECAQIIKNKGFFVVCIFSKTQSLIEWAKLQHIDVVTDINVFFELVKTENIDYLFSIQNSVKISSSVLQNIKQLAINYHNSPLPQYGGNENNTSWMIWNNEKEGGVTWHVISNLMDGGDILKQSKFVIDNNETVFSLQLKCQENAKQTLHELLEEVIAKKITKAQQRLDHRLFFYSYSRPCGFAVIDWDNNAEDIYRQFRAFNFGIQANNITILKFKHKNKYYAVLEMEIIKNKTIGAAGTIIKVEDNKLQIATQSFDIWISYRPTDFDEISFIPITVGDVLENEIYPLSKQKKIAELAAKDEMFWKNELLTFVPGKNFTQSNPSIYNNYRRLFNVKFDEVSSKPRINLYDILAVILGYLYRINNYENFSLCVGGKITHGIDRHMSDLFLPIKPLNIDFDNELDFLAIKKITKNLFSKTINKSQIFKDMLLRYPNNRENIFLNTLLLNFNDDSFIPQNVHHPIIININKKNQSISLLVSDEYLNSMPFFLNFMEEHLRSIGNSWPKLGNKLNTFDLLSLQESELLRRWNDAVVDYPKHTPIGELMDSVCMLHPNNIALESQEKKITYYELKLYSDRIAKNILSTTTRCNLTNEFIGVFLDKSVDTIVTFLAILKAGLTYVVLDPAYPDSYLKHIINSSQIQIFISFKNNVNRINNIVANIKNIPTPVFLDLANILSKQNVEVELSAEVTNTNPAYILFTSGSTSSPKGVIISHRSVINLAHGVIFRVGITAADRVLQFATLAFDTSVWEIYATLFAGATLYIPSKAESIVGDNLKITIIKQSITSLVLSPSVLNVQPYFESNNLKTIIVGGEECSARLPKQWGQYYNLLNAYGPTECTVTTTLSQALNSNTEITIGSPLPNYQVMICDKYQQPLVLGAVGEIIIGGDGVSEGYINDSKLTGEKFKKLDFLGKKTFAYLSGDLGKWAKNGEIKYIGRRDTQLKIRGFRVETGIIEEVLATYPGINTGVVLPDKTIHGETSSLQAYILMNKNGIKPELCSIRNFLKDKIPNFMIPGKFFIIEDLPLTTTGKIDRKKILTEKNLEQILDKVNDLPKTIIQQEIAAIWQEIFGSNHDLDIGTDFFELGGNSLQVTRMLFNIQKKYNLEISTPEFLKIPNIKHLESMILNKDITLYEQKNANGLIIDDLAEFEKHIICKRETLNNKQKAKKINKVFLTGLTGFLGSYVAKSFLDNNTELFCLVRSSNSNIHTRVRGILKSYGWHDKDIARLHLLEGDLSKKNFGLNLRLYEQLASDVDAICNTAAFVHHLRNYNQLKSANLYSVWNCIEFAYTKKPKYFAHVSSLSLLSGVKNGAEHEDFINLAVLNNHDLNGYNSTKLAAELCLNEVLEHNDIPLKIYRPGWIGGDSSSGVFGYENNHLFLFVKGCLQMKLAPRWDAFIDMIPVDYVAKFITHSMLYDEAWNRVYNMVAPIPMQYQDFMRYFADKTKTDIKFVSYKHWQDLLKNSTANNAIYPLLSLYLEIDNQKSLTKTYNVISTYENIKNTMFLSAYNKLMQSNIPSMEELIPIYYEYLRKSIFFDIDRQTK
jgi:amino acid adenylation domain-containing protein/thioester reductase-like protein